MGSATVVPGAPDTGVPEVRVPGVRVPDLEEAMDAVRAEVAVIAGRLNRAHADLVNLTTRLVDGQLWAGGGIRSPEHWLILTAGLSPAHARDVVRLARRRQEITPALALLDQGQLSIHQAAEIARHAPASHADSVTEFARHATVPQLRRVLARYPFPPEPDHPEPGPHEGALDAPADGEGGDGQGQDRQQPRFAGPPELVVKERAPASLTMGFDAGRFRLVYDAPADVGALVETAVREAKDALFTAGQTQATLGDALTEVAHRSLATVASRSRRDHYRVLVHLDTHGGWLNGRPALPAHLVDKLTCDGTLTPVWETQGRPVSVGRAMRIAPRGTRRLVEDRDRGCRFPGCTTVGFLDNHHIHHWRHGGPTDLDHLVSLCPYHHDAVHANQITVTGDPTTPHGLTFRNHAGLEIRGPHYTPPPPPSDQPDPATVAAVMTREAGSALPALWQHQPIPGIAPHDTPYSGPTGQQLHPQWVEFTAN